jgi:hypothetical protein
LTDISGVAEVDGTLTPAGLAELCHTGLYRGSSEYVDTTKKKRASLADWPSFATLVSTESSCEYVDITEKKLASLANISDTLGAPF